MRSTLSERTDTPRREKPDLWTISRTDTPRLRPVDRAAPSLFLQRAIAALVTPIGRLRGYKGRYEEYLTREPSMIVEPEPLPVVHPEQ